MLNKWEEVPELRSREFVQVRKWRKLFVSSHFLFIPEAGMYALRERRVHVTQEDFEMAVAKIMQKDSEKNMSIKKLFK